MKIKNRIALLSSLTFGIVFIITSILVYWMFYRSSENLVFNELEKSSLLTAIFYLEEDELSSSEYKIIKQQFKDDIRSNEVKVYNNKNIICYGNLKNDTQITALRLDEVRKNKSIRFKYNEFFYYGIFYSDNQGDFVVFVKSKNDFFYTQNNQLLFILVVVFFIGLFLIIIISRILSILAYQPITNVIKQVQGMDPESLNQPIMTTNTHDEVQDLINTFNNLLQRLSDIFANQKNFINYISHEFKTPLAAISGNLEVFAQKERTQQEYQQVVKDSLENVYHIEKILNTLMMVSGFKTVTDQKEYFRVDELIWDIIRKLQKIYPYERYKIEVQVVVIDQNLLQIKGHKMPIYIALYNIIENAFKYSNSNPIKIILLETHDVDSQVKNATGLQVHIKDQGKGISSEELKYIQQPFYRGRNVGSIKGNGIGLSLAVLIFKQHTIKFTIYSEENKGTFIAVFF